ncbi:unnamed protein product, partial [marine sediment metagenome]
DDKLKNIEKKVQHFAQEQLDRIKLKQQARDFIEDALVQRTVWLQLVPILNGKDLEKIDFNVLKWFDVWFDTKQKKVEETDVFIRKYVKLYKILGLDKVYFNLDKIKQTTPPDDVREEQEYEAKQGDDASYGKREKTYYDPENNSSIDEV